MLYFTVVGILNSIPTALRSAWSESMQTTDGLSVLEALVDTLVPADEQPGALDLGLDLRLRRYADGHPEWEGDLPRLLKQVDRLARERSGRGFARLSLQQREQLLAPVLKGDAPMELFILLRRVHTHIVRWYYTSPEGHSALNYLPPANYPARRMGKS